MCGGEDGGNAKPTALLSKEKPLCVCTVTAMPTKVPTLTTAEAPAAVSLERNPNAPPFSTASNSVPGARDKVLRFMGAVLR